MSSVLRVLKKQEEVGSEPTKKDSGCWEAEKGGGVYTQHWQGFEETEAEMDKRRNDSRHPKAVECLWTCNSLITSSLCRLARPPAPG